MEVVGEIEKLQLLLYSCKVISVVQIISVTQCMFLLFGCHGNCNEKQGTNRLEEINVASSTKTYLYKKVLKNVL